MHILAFILLFIIGAIVAAGNGDYSGVAAIAKIVGGIVLFFGILWLLTNPILLIMVIALLIIIAVGCSGAK